MLIAFNLSALIKSFFQYTCFNFLTPSFLLSSLSRDKKYLLFFDISTCATKGGDFTKYVTVPSCPTPQVIVVQLTVHQPKGFSKAALDCYNYSPRQHLRKCVETSVENMHTDVRV